MFLIDWWTCSGLITSSRRPRRVLARYASARVPRERGHETAHHPVLPDTRPGYACGVRAGARRGCTKPVRVAGDLRSPRRNVFGERGSAEILRGSVPSLGVRVSGRRGKLGMAGRREETRWRRNVHVSSAGPCQSMFLRRCYAEHWRDTHRLAPARRSRGGTTAHHRLLPDVHVHSHLAQDILAGAVPARDRPYAPPASTFITQERGRGTRPRRGPARKRCIAVRTRQHVRRESENGGLKSEKETREECTSFDGGKYTPNAPVCTHETSRYLPGGSARVPAA
jgi:hypothetical protein